MTGLDSIVLDHALRVGLSASQVDVSALTDQVEGFLVASQGKARQHLAPLLETFDISPVDDGDKIIFKRIGTGTVRSIPMSDLLPFDDQAVPFEHIRRHRVELPAQLHIRYPDRDGDYQTAGQAAIRSRQNSAEVQTMDVPVVLTATQAKEIATRKLQRMYSEGDVYSFRLPIQYADLLQEDLITLNNDLPIEPHWAGVITERSIVVKEIGFDGLALIVTGYGFDADSLTTDVAVDPIAYPPSVVGAIVDTEAIFLDIPSLRPEDNGRIGTYVGLTRNSLLGNWDGASLHRSADGQAFEQVASLNVSLVHGIVDSAMAAGPSHVIDEATGVVVRMEYNEFISSISNEQFENMGNLALIGREVIAFRDVELVTTDVYRISHLRRGMLGTEAEIDRHGETERFVLLTPTTLAFVDHPAGVSRFYKAVTDGQAIGQIDAVEYVNAAVMRQPLAPADPRLSIAEDGSGDLQLSWRRRVRGYIQWGGADSPLGDGDAVLFDVEVLTAAGQVKRTLASATTRVTYSQAQQITDFATGLPQPLTVRLYQISPAVGRGSVCEAALDITGSF